VFILAKRHHSSANLPSVKDQAGDRPATLRDLLDADVVGKLKAAAEQLKAEEQQKKRKAPQRSGRSPQSGAETS